MKPIPKLAASLAAALLVVLSAGAGLFWFVADVQNAANVRHETLEGIGEAHNLLAAMVDAETGERGYVVTGDVSFLAPYFVMRDSVPGQLAALRRRNVDSASREHLNAVGPLVTGSLAHLADVIALRRNQDLAGADALVGSGKGRQLMDAIRAEIQGFVAAEDAALTRHDAEFKADLRRLFILIVVVGLFALLWVVAFGWLIHQRTRQRLEVESILKTAEIEEKLAVTLNSIGDGVIATDADARVTLLNQVAEQLTGWVEADALGRPVGEIFQIINKDTRKPAAIPVLKTLAQGTVQGLANHTVLIARDGTERDIADSCAPIRVQDGPLVGAVLVFRDVTAEYAAGQALRDSTALVQTVLNTVADAIVTIHADGGLVKTVNPAAERMFGYPAAELAGHRFSLLVPELDQGSIDGSLEYYQPDDAARASGLGREVAGRHQDGSPVPIEIAVSDMMLGGRRYFTAVLRDLTARKRAEAALQRAGALQRAIFESATFSSIATDAKGVIQIFNVGAERMLGYAAAEVMNRMTPAELSDAGEVTARATALSVEFGTPIAPGFEALVFRAARGIEDIYELTYIRKDGSRLPAAVSVTPLRDELDQIIGYLLIGTDNTARKVVEAERGKLDQRLRDQQFYTRSLIESNVDALMTTDPAGIITDVNRQMEILTGCTRDELLGAPFKDSFTDPERAAAGIRLVLSDKKVTNYELTVRARDGTTTMVSYNATTFYDRGRSLQGVFAAARDVTESKRVEEALRLATAAAQSASRTKSDFLASMSHEIRTPMNAMMGVADLLSKTPLSPEQDKYVRIFRRAGDNLLNLINDILDLSKVEAAQLELEHTGFSLSELLDKVMEVVAVGAEPKGLALACEVAPDVPTDLVGDPTRLQQVLLNVVGNAVKFTAAGEVSLRVSRDPDSAVPTALRFTVTDTGIGIPPEKLGRVFERFTQADSSTTRRFGGSGLGLTISKRLVELMGGQIWAESNNRGSVFSIVVPFEAWNRPDVRPPVKAENGGPHGPVPALRILLAEDSDDNRTIVLAYLADSPYRVEIAETGAVACSMFAARHYDLVLMDRQMPVMDGLTATRAIRVWEQAHGRSPTPIIALTASALRGDRELCLAAGCTAYLTKPINQAALLHAIRAGTLPVPFGTKAGIQPEVLGMGASRTLAALVPAFLRDREADVQTMRDAVTRGDFAAVARLGHNMKGAGASFGFPAISDIGASLELTARSGDPTATGRSVDDLARYLDQVEPPVVGAVAARPSQRSSRVTPRRIVLVEDNELLREAFHGLLERNGHTVSDAADGITGLALILAERPPVAIIDIGLGGMDGYEVARKVREALGNAVFLVALTGFGQATDRARSLSAGFDAHLVKPVDIDLVERMIDARERAGED